MLPTFAAAVPTPSGGATFATDYLGFRHVFHGERDAAGVVSTSSYACARELGSGLDLDAVAVQSSLGWQLDQRTLFEGVRKLAPASSRPWRTAPSPSRPSPGRAPPTGPTSTTPCVRPPTS